MLPVYKEKIALWDWYEIESTGSTNDEIKRLIPSSGNSVALSAVRQTGGRGRRGRGWQEIEGNLYLTFSVEIPAAELSRYVCLIGLSLAETIKEIAPQSDVRIKWPNDVFLGGKKLSGILLENICGSLWAVGIGVNVAAAPDLSGTAYKAGSLKENGIMLDRIEFLHYYLAKFASGLEQYRREGFLPLKERWLSLALNRRQKISVKTETAVKTGEFLTIDDNGYLMLKTGEGIERIVAGDLFI